MKTRYWLYRRGKTFYLHDKQTGKQESLRTKVKAEAERIRQARNEAEAQPTLNLALARAYLSAHDPKMVTRQWQEVMDLMASKGKEVTQMRCANEMKRPPFDRIRNKTLHETSAEDFLAVLAKGGSSTNSFLRRLHNLALGLGWLAWPIMSSKNWPRPKTLKRRAITWAEHQQIINSTVNAEWRNFYDLLWEVGASQSDGAVLRAENIDWENKVLTYSRMKLSGNPGHIPACLQIGERLIQILRRLPSNGFLFPRIHELSSNHRAAEFRRKCKLLDIHGVSLHSYRYAWAQRAKVAGYPERWAKAALVKGGRKVQRGAVEKCGT